MRVSLASGGWAEIIFFLNIYSSVSTQAYVYLRDMISYLEYWAIYTGCVRQSSVRRTHPFAKRLTRV